MPSPQTLPSSRYGLPASPSPHYKPQAAPRETPPYENTATVDTKRNESKDAPIQKVIKLMKGLWRRKEMKVEEVRVKDSDLSPIKHWSEY